MFADSLGTVSRKFWTAAALEKLSPAEQDELFASSLVTDLDELPAEFVARVRARIQQRIDASESSPQR